MSYIQALQINPHTLTVTAENPREQDLADRLTLSLQKFQRDVLGLNDCTPQAIITYLLEKDPESSKAAVIAIAHDLPLEGLPKSKYIRRCFEKDPDDIREEAAEITVRVRREIAAEPFDLPADTSVDRGQVIVCMSRGLYWAYVRVDGAMCEPGSLLAERLGPDHWAPKLCRNVNRILYQVQGYLLGEVGIEDYLETMEDRELVDAIAAGAAGAKMDEQGRIPGYRPDWESKQ